jgi:hypothetical protein
MRVRSSFLVGFFGNLPSILPSWSPIRHSKPSAVVHLLPGGGRLGEAQRERAVEAVVQVHRAVLELVGAGEPERAQRRRLGPLQTLRRPLTVGAVVVDHVRVLGLRTLRGEGQHGVLLVEGVVEAIHHIPKERPTTVLNFTFHATSKKEGPKK